MKRRIPFLVALLFTTSADAKTVKVERNSDLLKFSYEWSSEAAQVPALNQRFMAELEKAFREARANAVEDQRLARNQKREYHQEYYSKRWTTAGQTPRLLSLQSELGTFTGGAHPNTSYGALLWDRKSKREIALNALFLKATVFGAVNRARYCHALDLERGKRRQGKKLGGDFDQCPKFSELAITLVDKDGNRRFDTIDFIASPYAAGPYVEGKYASSLPVTSELIRGIRPEYRDSFERQRQ